MFRAATLKTNLSHDANCEFGRSYFLPNRQVLQRALRSSEGMLLQYLVGDRIRATAAGAGACS